jgi:hypothetical protein
MSSMNQNDACVRNADHFDAWRALENWFRIPMSGQDLEHYYALKQSIDARVPTKLRSGRKCMQETPTQFHLSCSPIILSVYLGTGGCT